MNAVKIGLAAMVAMLLVGANAGYAASPPQPLSLLLSGAVVSAGEQSYSFQGGNLVFGELLGVPVDITTAVHYDLSAKVSGLTVTGVAHFGALTAKGTGGAQTELQAAVAIDGMVPAVGLPIGCTFGVNCNSAIPALFSGGGSAKVTTGHTTFSFPIHMTLESPYLNPFGGPIFISSDAGEVFVIATYSQARIVWTNILVQGLVSGRLSGSTVSGSFGMVVNSIEDLKAGSELDHGTISFHDMSPVTLNALGTFSGNSTIPRGVPCPDSLGFPAGTCTITGLMSSGAFSQSTALHSTIMGKYATTWSAPAVAFGSVVTATLK